MLVLLPARHTAWLLSAAADMMAPWQKPLGCGTTSAHVAKARSARE